MNPFPYTAFANVARLAIEAQQVIALRCMVFAIGGAKARRETRRMVREKLVASGQIGMANATAFAQGKSAEAIGARTVSDYRKIVRRNRARLSK
jgi:hypothetical protein